VKPLKKKPKKLQGSPTPKPSLASLEKKTEALRKKVCYQAAEICNLAQENQKLRETLLRTFEAGDDLASVCTHTLAYFRLGLKKTEKENFQKAFKNWVLQKSSLREL
jgi:hypothetical protein